jgi:hypothetical protein
VNTVTAVRACVVAAILVPSAALPNDRWEQGSIAAYSNDDGLSTTRNELRPGDRQAGHDLEGTPAAPDRDFYLIQTEVYHTYEAIVRSGTLFWSKGTPFCVATSGTNVCPRFDLFNPLGIQQLEGTADGASNDPSVASALRIVMYGNGSTNFLRVQGDTGGSPHNSLDQYDIVFRDTTYSVPRFNNSASQTTILIVQNTTGRSVHADATFLDANGAMLAIAGTNITPFGTWVLPSAGIPQLASKSGSILVRQDGPYGALSGKAVSLEPVTGFTFDTAMTPISQ